MAKHLVLVLTEPTAGEENAFNTYYEDIHLDEVLASAGWDSAQRFRLVDEVGEACPLPYLAAYTVDAEDSAQVLAQLNDSRPQRQQSSALNKRTGRIWVFRATGPEHTLTQEPIHAE